MFFVLCLKQWLMATRLRYDFYRKFGIVYPSTSIVNRADEIRIGADFGISPNCQIFCQDPESGSQLTIGDRVKLNFGVMINADRGGRIYIGDDVLIGPNVVLRAANHKFTDTSIPVTKQGHSGGEIKVENNVWIGANVVILPNVSIGTGSAIAAGSIVIKPIPARVVAGGVPAKVLREID